MIENDIKINVERDLNEIEAKQFKLSQQNSSNLSHLV